MVLEKNCSVCGGHLISMNFPPRNWKEYYAYSSRLGGKLCLLKGVRTLPLLRSGIGARTLPFIHLVIYIGLVHDKFCLVLHER
jgi:hypothetical protein